MIGISLRAGAVALGLCLAGQAAAQTPSSVRILYGFAAGSAGDTLSRIVAERMQAELGRPVTVENRVGASGRTAIQAVKNATPDGSLIFVGPNGPMTILPLHDPNAGFDPAADFAPISQLVTFDFAFAASPKVIPARSIAEMIPILKAKPDLASYGTPGAGSNNHFLGIALAAATGLPLRVVHYRGAAPALNDVVAGQLPFMISPLSDQLEQHRAGGVRILASAGDDRSPFAPDVATFQEQGLPIRALGWYAAYAPAKTPPAIVDRWNAIMKEAVTSPQVRPRLDSLAFVATASSPQALADQQAKEIEYWRPIIKASGFRTEP